MPLPLSDSTGSNRWQLNSKIEKITSLSLGRGALTNKWYLLRKIFQSRTDRRVSNPGPTEFDTLLYTALYHCNIYSNLLSFDETEIGLKNAN